MRWLNSISRKLTFFYAALFALALAIAFVGAQRAIEHHAEGVISRETAVNTAVFNRLLEMRNDQMREAASVTASDFGFREAVALGDAPTVNSALDNLRNRLDLSMALLVTLDGRIVGAGEHISAPDRAAIFEAVDSGAEGGMLMIGDSAFGTVVSEVNAPMLMGWVVFGYRADARELASIADLSALHATARIADGSELESGHLREIAADGERFLVSANRLESLVPGREAVLVLRYSLSDALAGYRPMLWLLALVGAVAFMLAIVGSFLVARVISRPIKALAEATRQVSMGDHAQVRIESSDEIGDLAQSFNRMVVAVEERERQISRLAFNDTLTGLPNRVLFREQLEQALRRKEAGELAVICVDLDNFKAVNDTLGHPIGDKLLARLAESYVAALDDDLIARLSGDEFAILVRGDIAAIQGKARAIIAATGETFVIDGHSIAIGASAGIAIAHQDGGDADTLLKNADLALHRAKEDGKNTWRFFEPRMDAHARERRLLEMDLRDALRKRQLELYFQPLFSLKSNSITSFEALLRWNHPTRGLVPPNDFIPLAEDTGLIVPIGEWVLHEACRIASGWDEEMRIAVNISPVQFRNPGLKNVILQAIARSGLAPDRLELEITESLFIDDVETTLKMLHDVRRLGVRIALDDFGTGYSSLAYLRSFPFDKIKIDRSFIVDLLTSEGASAIVRSITALAEALGMETTAEGVEESEQLDMLRAQGCSHIQGFLFSKPVAEGQIEELLATIRGAPGRRREAA